MSSLRHLLTTIVPPLSLSSHKGQSGRICVIGGCKHYTGAPFFAALSSLKFGADLSSVLCSIDSATPIKVYSPELMTRPLIVPSYLAHTDGLSSLCGSSKSLNDVKSLVSSEFNEILQRMNSVVVGPGLGRDDFSLDQVESMIVDVVSKGLPLVIDGDGIHVITQRPQIIKGCKHCVVTPNAAEFSRLWNTFLPNVPLPSISLPVTPSLVSFIDSVRSCDSNGSVVPFDSDFVIETVKLSKSMGVTVLRKGPIDVISDGDISVCCVTEGAPRRCGGQGDVLAGAVGTATLWAEKWAERNATKCKESKDSDLETILRHPTVCGAFVGAMLTRGAANIAFTRHGRGMLAHHIVDACEDVINKWAPISSSI